MVTDVPPIHSLIDSFYNSKTSVRRNLRRKLKQKHGTPSEDEVRKAVAEIFTPTLIRDWNTYQKRETDLNDDVLQRTLINFTRIAADSLRHAGYNSFGYYEGPGSQEDSSIDDLAVRYELNVESICPEMSENALSRNRFLSAAKYERVMPTNSNRHTLGEPLRLDQIPERFLRDARLLKREEAQMLAKRGDCNKYGRHDEVILSTQHRITPVIPDRLREGPSEGTKPPFIVEARQKSSLDALEKLVPYLIGEREDFRDTLAMRFTLPRPQFPWFLSEFAEHEGDNIALMNFHYLPLEDALNYVLGDQKSHVTHNGYQTLKKLASKMTVEKPDQDDLRPRPPGLEIIYRVPGTAHGIIEIQIRDPESANRSERSVDFNHTEYKARQKRDFFQNASPLNLEVFRVLSGVSVGEDSKASVDPMLYSLLPVDPDRRQAAIEITARKRAA